MCSRCGVTENSSETDVPEVGEFHLVFPMNTYWQFLGRLQIQLQEKEIFFRRLNVTHEDTSKSKDQVSR